MSIDKRAATCDPDSNLMFKRKKKDLEDLKVVLESSTDTKIVKPVWRIALSKVIIQPSAYCRETSFIIGKAEHTNFILAVCRFKLMVITGAWKYVLKRVFKGRKNC